ncbi:hypothetical protein GYMLUDRAFT_1012319 [Collybiopsis luxurians FD-317 M1]|uniref:acireductone dioxygenase (Fe(2+)-requiring) n=1 Tax=Collybiopsis luxurians FD-317 M1 TaxID=944289 RepID=A0A0D0C3G6_9AGAR|nr:hypothetical protein GYMLUDRAFT_1012319 [Collybiopsis luxurians FD-317 M1]
MQAYYLSNPTKSVTPEALDAFGFKMLHVAVTATSQNQVSSLARERGYKSTEPTPNDPAKQWAQLGGTEGQLEQMKQFFAQEKTTGSETMFYVTSGGGFYDVRDPTSDAWIRIPVVPGLVLAFPAGAYHRYIMDGAYAKGFNWFKDPSLVKGSLTRSAESDNSAQRKAYLNSLGIQA